MSLSSLAGKSKLPGREIKIISWIWVCLQKPSTQKPARWLLGCPPAQMCQHTWSLANSSPQALLCTPHPLRKTRSRSLAPKLQNSRPDVGWVCSCYKFLHIKKKKKSCTCQDDKVCFSTGGSCSRAHGLGVERVSRPLSPVVLARALPSKPKQGDLNVSPHRCRTSFQNRRQKGLHPGKKKRHFCCWLKPLL